MLEYLHLQRNMVAMISRFYLYIGFVFACVGFFYKCYQTLFETICFSDLYRWWADATTNLHNSTTASDIPAWLLPKLTLDEGSLYSKLLAIEAQGASSSYSNDDNTSSWTTMTTTADECNSRLRVAVGFGSCKDQFIRAVDFFRIFGIDHAKAQLSHYNHIESREQLEEMFLFYFTKGIAAERFVSNKLLFSEIAQTVNAHNLPTKEALGGNAPVMASRFAKDGCSVFLGSIIGSALHKLANVDPRITVLNEDAECGDVHILMEYDVKDRIGDNFRAPRANRFIVHSDDSNPHISVLERFFDGLVSFKPHLIVIGGLQMMDNFPYKEGEMESRLRLLGAQLSAPSLASSIVHFELASFTDPNLMKHLTDNVISSSDSVGMNEQELANLHSYLLNGTVTLAEDAYVDLEVELEKIRTVFALLEERPRSRVLTRLHLHTVLFQVLAIRRPPSSALNCEQEEKDTKYFQWKNGRLAVARASLMATRHACQKTEVDISKVKLVFRGPVDLSSASNVRIGSRGNGGSNESDDDDPVFSWTETVVVKGMSSTKSSPHDQKSNNGHRDDDDDINIEFYVAPVLMCTDVKQTTGGGDNISPVGLVSQLSASSFVNDECHQAVDSDHIA